MNVWVTARLLNGVSDHDCSRDQHGQQQAESSGRTGHGGGREHCDDPVHGGHDVDAMGRGAGTMFKLGGGGRIPALDLGKLGLGVYPRGISRCATSA